VRKRILVMLGASVCALAVFTAGAAYAVNTFRTGGTTVRQHIATTTDPFAVPGPGTWQTVPVTAMSVTVPAGQRRLITATFTAESNCLGPASSWCSVRIVYTRTGPLTELAPQSGVDYAFDSPGGSWESHGLERTSAVYLGAGTYRVFVQALRNGATRVPPRRLPHQRGADRPVDT